MKVLVFGASGLLGREMCHLLKRNEIEYLGTYYTNPVENSVFLDIENKESVLNLIQEYKPNICILCIVKRYTDICEKNWDEIKYSNIDVVSLISRSCHDHNVYLIHISTDYVFDGKSPPYAPCSIPNPLQNYGVSKLISEYRVMSNTQEYSIVRVPVLYSDKAKTYEESAVTAIGKKVLNRITKSQEDNYFIRRPVFVEDLCVFIFDIIQNSSKFHGIYHFYNPFDKVTKYQISNIIGNYLNKTIDHVEPVNEEIKKSSDMAERPFDTRLIDVKFDINKYAITRIEKGIQRCFSKIYHPKLYGNPRLNFSELFIMLDLDGTLIDSEKLHVNAYNAALDELQIKCKMDSTECDIYEYLNRHILDENVLFQVKELKKRKMLELQENVSFVKGAENLIHFIYENKINHCVVTNTSSVIVEMFKNKNKTLQKLTNYITREDYDNPKPHAAPYQLALTRYSRNEKYVIGFENTLIGYQSLQQVTPCIYMICQNPAFMKQMEKYDVYLINHFNDL